MPWPSGITPCSRASSCTPCLAREATKPPNWSMKFSVASVVRSSCQGFKSLALISCLMRWQRLNITTSRTTSEAFRWSSCPRQITRPGFVTRLLDGFGQAQRCVVFRQMSPVRCCSAGIARMAPCYRILVLVSSALNRLSMVSLDLKVITMNTTMTSSRMSACASLANRMHRTLTPH
ncbi:hypothetical protein SDC9_196007 [bioreactor metagenome]|uniref:Uncharacterized protein n=1 Tax=bioreactor metagenome TaxID=1076179 RepID=A0A645IB95_9ZZZZ